MVLEPWARDGIIGDRARRFDALRRGPRRALMDPAIITTDPEGSPPETPAAVLVDGLSGRLDGATGSYVKRLSDLADVYADREAYRRLTGHGGDEVHYVVHEHRGAERAGDLIFGTSTVFPGTVGREFHLTRGHVHRRTDRSEIYHCLAGHGVMLMERDGRIKAIELRAGVVAYVAGHWAHRTVNVGAEPLVTLFCYPADAGQDYAALERRGGMAQLVVADSAGGWRLDANPRYVSDVCG